MQFKRTNIPYTGRDKYAQIGNGNKYRRTTKIYGTGGGSGGGGSIEPLPWTGNTQVSAELSRPISNIPLEQLTVDGYTVDVPINGYANDDVTQVWVGTTTGDSTTNYGISGVTTGMSVSISDNGTTEPILHVTFRSTITSDSGELQIPVLVNKSTYLENFGTTAAAWGNMESLKKVTPKVLTYCWNIKSAGGGTGYIFDLTNENSSVNADSEGNIYTASTATLECQAILYYNATVATGATYAITATTATGVSINASTGVLTFANNFIFTGLTASITITASVDGSVKGTKVMRITKVKDGAGGSATRRWIVPSVYSTVLGVDSSVTPSVVTATVMKQTGGNAAETDSATTIFYGFSPGNINPTITMPSTGITVDASVEYLILALREGNVSNGTIYESETIPMISDGSGPSVRGPILWKSSLARRFCNGVGPNQTDRNFIDIIRYQIHTYKCITSYTQTAGSSWASVSENWELDDSYHFVASVVDLDQNEVIRINASNAIQVYNGNDTITGSINYNGISVGDTEVTSGYTKSASFLSDGVINSTQKATMSVLPFEVIVVTNEKNYFAINQETKRWEFNGIDSGVDAERYPYCWYVEEGFDDLTDYVGYWVYSMLDQYDGDINTVVFAGVVTSSATRYNDKIYLTI